MKKCIALALALMMAASLTAGWAEEEEAVGITPYAYWAVETLPKIYIETEEGIALDDPSLVNPDEHKGMNGEITVYNYVNATVTVTDCEGFELDGVDAQVKIRGNYTSNYPKKPIRIKFAESQAMCGLNGGNALKSWVLLAEYKDPSLLRNSVAFYIANSLYSTTGNYCTDFRNVEVYLNGEYNGLYVLAEQQQVNKYRVNIPQPENPKNYDLDTLTEEEQAALRDGHTGYLFEYDGYYTNEKPEDTFTIRYDWVTRPNGQTFLPTSEGNAEASDEAASAPAEENNGASAGWQNNGDTAAEENNGASAGWQNNGDAATEGNNDAAPANDASERDNNGASDGASAGRQNNGEASAEDNNAAPAGNGNNAAPANGTNERENDGASGGSRGGQNNNSQNNNGQNNNSQNNNGQNNNSQNNNRDNNGASFGGQNNGGFGGGWGWGTDSNLGTTRKTGFTITSDFYYKEQNAFIQHTLQTVWDVLYDAVYTDHSDLAANPYHTMDGDGNYVADAAITTAYDAIASVVDIDSLIDMYIIQEIAMDSDLNWSSFYFSIDMNPEGNHLLTYTAPWDFDSGFSTGSNTSTLYAVNYDNPWLVLFCNQGWFWQRLNQRWDEAMEAGVFSGVLEMVDTLARINEAAYQQNLERWPSSGTEGASGGGSWSCIPTRRACSRSGRRAGAISGCGRSGSPRRRGR